MIAINYSTEKKALRVKGIMMVLVLLTAVLGFTSVPSVSYSDTTVYFYGISPTYYNNGQNTSLVSIPDGYAGFTWSTSWGVRGFSFEDYAVPSYPNVAVALRYQEQTISRDAPFDFKSAWLAGYYFDASILVKGYRGSTLLYDTTLLAPGNYNFAPRSDPGPSVVFNWTGIDRLTFYSEGGSGPMGSFEMDNFTYADSVPIPAAVWLLGSGLVGLVGLRRKFKK